jgi:hypothetical protein
MMADHFGAHYVVHGELRTKFIKPTYANVPITTRGQITDRTVSANGDIKITMEVWCEDDKGTKLTVGDASVLVTAALGE